METGAEAVLGDATSPGAVLDVVRWICHRMAYPIVTSALQVDMGHFWVKIGQ